MISIMNKSPALAAALILLALEASAQVSLPDANAGYTLSWRQNGLSSLKWEALKAEHANKSLANVAGLESVYHEEYEKIEWGTVAFLSVTVYVFDSWDSAVNALYNPVSLDRETNTSGIRTGYGAGMSYNQSDLGFGEELFCGAVRDYVRTGLSGEYVDYRECLLRNGRALSRIFIRGRRWSKDDYDNWVKLADQKTRQYQTTTTTTNKALEVRGNESGGNGTRETGEARVSLLGKITSWIRGIIDGIKRLFS